MSKLVDEVAAARGLTAEIVEARRGVALNEWVLVKPLRAPTTVDNVWTGVGKKSGLYEDLFVVVSDAQYSYVSGAGLRKDSVVAIVKQLAVSLQADGELLAIKFEHIIAVIPEGSGEQPDSA